MKRLFLLIALLTAQPALATTYYVAKTGGGSTCSSGSPCLTIAVGLTKLASTDTLEISAGTYVEAIDTDSQEIPSGTSWNNLTMIQGKAGDTVIIKPSGTGVVFRVNTPSAGQARRYIGLKNLILDGTDAAVGGVGSTVSIGGGGNGGVVDHIKLDGITARNSIRANVYIGGADGSGTDNWMTNSVVHHAGLNSTDNLAHHGIYVESSGNLIEYTEIYDNQGFGIHNYAGTPNNNIYRYNYVHDNGYDVDPGSAVLLASGTGNRVYNNIIANNQNTVAIWTNDNIVYNNVIYNSGQGWTCRGGTCDDAAIYTLAGTSGNVIKNNLINNNVTNSISDNGSGNTVSSNLTTGSTASHFVNAAGGDFSLVGTSSAIDNGTADVGTGQPLTCAGNCDIGVFEAPKLLSCSATGNTLSLVFDNPRFPPLSNLAVTGITGTIDGTSRTLSSPAIAGSNQVDITFNGAAVSATATSAGSTSVTITDSANIGNVSTNVQKVLDWGTTNCSVSGGGGTTIAQTHFRGADLLGGLTSQVWLNPVDTNFTVQQGGCFRCRLKAACTGGDCPAFAPVIRYSIDGGAYTATTLAFDADNFKYYGTSDTSPDIPAHLTAITNEVLTSDYGTNVNASFLRSPDSVPNIDLSQNSEVEVEGAFCIDRDAPIGTTYDLRLYKGDGSALDGYTLTPRITIVAPGMYNTSQLGPWDVELRLGSQLTLGNLKRRSTDRSKFVYPEVPKSAVVYLVH